MVVLPVQLSVSCKGEAVADAAVWLVVWPLVLLQVPGA